MPKACFASQMREVDRSASEKGGIPSIVLMENAAVSCVRELQKDFGLTKKSAAIFCGKGNNGGDGFAIARHLYNLGANVCVYLVCGNEFAGDAAINFDIIKKMNIPVEAITDTESLEYIIKSHDIIIDAIFGTGIHGAVRGIAYDVIEAINENAEYVLSVDIPSGVDSDSGAICGVCVKADKTVTFAAYKIGMLMFPASDYVGETVVADISIPRYIIEDQNLAVNVTDDKFVRENFPKRTNNSQKGDYGKVLIIAGSEGMTGAAYLAAQTAVLAGSGLVFLTVPRSVNAVLEVKTTEAMTIPVDSEDGHLSACAIDEILKRSDGADAVLIGPGLGRSDDIRKILAALLEYSKAPVVIDADGINAAAKDMEMLSKSSCSLVFTPHAVEMSRLTGLDREYIEENRLLASREFAEEYGAAVILKGHRTVVTAPDGVQYINTTGNSGLATGGSGDVLAGLTVSLIARGVDETTAAAIAVYIHGRAGDIAAARLGEDSVTASSVMEAIPQAVCQILRG